MTEEPSQSAYSDAKQSGKLAHAKVAEQILQEMKLATIQETNEICEYRDGVYHQKAKYKILRRIESIMEGNVTRQFREEVLEHIRISTYVSIDDFDPDPDILNLRNGLFHVRKGELTPHTPNYLSLNQLPVSYGPKVRARLFEQSLKEALPDVDDRLLLLDHFAACLWRNPRLKKALILFGDTDSGKSTFLNVLIALIGHENVSDVTLQDLEQHRFQTFNLVGKLANIFADIDKKELAQSRRFKTSMGGDRITVEKKFGQPFETYLYAKQIYSCNQIPETRDESDAFFNRWDMIGWKVRFAKDDTLLSRLTQPEQLSGILNILLKRLRRIVKLGVIPNSQTPDEVRAIWLAQSDFVTMFWNENIVRDPEGEIEVNALYSMYVDFCKQKKITAKSRTSFNQRLESFGAIKQPTRRGKENIVLWRGIKLRSERDQSECRSQTNRREKTGSSASLARASLRSLQNYPTTGLPDSIPVFFESLDQELFVREAITMYTHQSNGLFLCGFCDIYRVDEDAIQTHIREDHIHVATKGLECLEKLANRIPETSKLQR
jgi:P4 family phage/plasmid primase-like protien